MPRLKPPYKALEARAERLREALCDLIDAASSRVPGDEACWGLAVDEAKRVLVEQ